MEKEIVEEFLISKEDLNKYFSCKKTIFLEELIKYYKHKNRNNFNAIFNATPKKNHKKRSETKES